MKRKLGYTILWIILLIGCKMNPPEPLKEEITELKYDILYKPAGNKFTILDYFFLFPQKYIGWNNEEKNQILNPSEEDRQPGIWISTTIDEKNGFFSYKRETDSGYREFEISLWKLKSGDDLIGYNGISADGIVESTIIKFFLFKNRKWTEVTLEYFPEISIKLFDPSLKKDLDDENNDYREDTFLCRLPRKGKNIECIISSLELHESKYNFGKSKAILQWKNEHFVPR